MVQQAERRAKTTLLRRRSTDVKVPPDCPASTLREELQGLRSLLERIVTGYNTRLEDLEKAQSMHSKEIAMLIENTTAIRRCQENQDRLLTILVSAFEQMSTQSDLLRSVRKISTLDD